MSDDGWEILASMPQCKTCGEEWWHGPGCRSESCPNWEGYGPHRHYLDENGEDVLIIGPGSGRMVIPAEVSDRG